MILNRPASFIHVPKTAGLSIGNVLKSYGVIVFEYDHHRKASSIAGTKVAFVRNPFDRLLSAYCFMRSTDKYDLKHRRFRDFVMNVFEYREFIHVRSQSFWLDSECVFIGRFENLLHDIKVLCKMIDPSKVIPEIPWLNKTCHRHYAEEYDNEMREVVVEFYSEDFRRFDYDINI